MEFIQAAVRKGRPDSRRQGAVGTPDGRLDGGPDGRLDGGPDSRPDVRPGRGRRRLRHSGPSGKGRLDGGPDRRPDVPEGPSQTLTCPSSTDVPAAVRTDVGTAVLTAVA